METMIFSFVVLILAFFILLCIYTDLKRRYVRLANKCEVLEAQKEFYKELAQKGIANISIDEQEKNKKC